MVHNKLKINLKCRRCNDFLVGGCITNKCVCVCVCALRLRLGLCICVWVCKCEWMRACIHKNWESGGSNASNTIISSPFLTPGERVFSSSPLLLLLSRSLRVLYIEYVNSIMYFYSLSCAIDFYVLLILFRSFCLPRHYLIACMYFASIVGCCLSSAHTHTTNMILWCYSNHLFLRPSVCCACMYVCQCKI